MKAKTAFNFSFWTVYRKLGGIDVKRIRQSLAWLDVQIGLLIALDVFLLYVLFKIVYTLTRFLMDFIPKVQALM